MQKTLVIMAAGMGSRYGGGIKQIEAVGPNNEIIIDFSIHDAISAGFNKIVIILRKDIKDDFDTVIGRRLKAVCEQIGIELAYVFQQHPLIDTELFPVGRKKPWGTADAVRVCSACIAEPFAVINADDYYGKSAFVKAASLLDNGGYSMIGYRLGNTLSDNGAVTRGICKVENGRLSRIVETSNIIRTIDGAEANGRKLSLDTVVSMNFWCFPKEFISELNKGFIKFTEEMKDPIKDEYLLPSVVSEMVNNGAKVRVVDTDDNWFGVTYHQDKEYVIEEFRKLYANGVYSGDLYSDLLSAASRI